MKNNINYDMLISDMYKIYLYCIDSNNVKKFQTINNKYTTIDTTMLACYIFFQLVQDKNLNLNDAKIIIGNALIKKLVNYSTGNLEVEIENVAHKKIYNEVKNIVFKEKMLDLNKNLDILKIDIVEIENAELLRLFYTCEELAEIFILLDLYLTGNELAYDFIINKIDMFKLENSYLENVSTLFNDVMINIDNKRKLLAILNQNNIYKLVRVALNLRNVSRFSQIHLIVPENVLFHTYENTIMIYVLCDYLKEIGENFDKYEVVIKSLFHDFTEYSGNEFISCMKLFSKETQELVNHVEQCDKDNLKNLISDYNLKIVQSYKKDFTGYIADLVDKITGIMKTLIEVKYYNNFTMLKVQTGNENKRFDKFYDYTRIESSNNKCFYTNLLKLHYTYILETFLENENIMATYFSKNEIDNIKAIIQTEKERLTL
ncbi:MAG: HD domain-containing protein [Clostridia bacterium]|nr:HD domain-containing protein [Clostridia bacterium]